MLAGKQYQIAQTWIVRVETCRAVVLTGDLMRPGEKIYVRDSVVGMGVRGVPVAACRISIRDIVCTHLVGVAVALNVAWLPCGSVLRHFTRNPNQKKENVRL